MKIAEIFQFILFIVLLTAITPPLGKLMAKVFEGEKTWLHKLFGWLEALTYKVSGINPRQEMGWKSYAAALLAFNFLGLIFLVVIQMSQTWLPLNPQNLPNISWHSAFNTAVSFVTNTNWQGYAGEVTMSYFSQMVGFTVQNFLSAACGIAVSVVLMRGISKKTTASLGNFWVDLTRATIYILLPISLVFSIALVSQGVIQTLSAYREITTLEGLKQIIALGPVASQVAIKMLGTNGGGFFNANASHPFENPSALSNFLQMLAIFSIGAGLTYTYGIYIQSQRHGWIIYGVMLSLFVCLTVTSLTAEYMNNPIFGQGGLMEGKETRFGVFNSVFFSSVTTSASCGAVNTMHSSLSPLSGGVALLNMMLGEIVIGGVGSGFYGMMLFILLTVFMSGLMIGRSPEYMGKKIEARDMTMVILAVLAPCSIILMGSALSILLPEGLVGISHKGPHGLSEVVYAFTSAAANNGSAFAGLSANTTYYNLMLAFAMLIGRFVIIVPVLAIAGQMAQKKTSPLSAGTFETDTVLFAVLLTGIILIVGALTFLPVLSLGPIVEYFLMIQRQTF